MSHYDNEVEVLIVAALEEEAEAVVSRLSDCRKTADAIVGTLRVEGISPIKVAVVQTGQTNMKSLQETSRVVELLNPTDVILVGICAGFKEAGVCEGDLLVPNYVFNYEHLKETDAEQEVDQPGLNDVEREPRSDPMEVAQLLWRVALEQANDEEATWRTGIDEARPDGSDVLPEVHCTKKGLLASGEKLLAADNSPEVRHVLKLFPKGGRRGEALGAEMEAAGVQQACHARSIRFLVVKAVQDHADHAKGDTWRRYAIDCAAAFVVELVGRIHALHQSVLASYRDSVEEALDSLARDAPGPRFEYTLCGASSYEELRRGVCSKGHDIEDVLPGPAAPLMMLHGGAGAGKTQVVRRLAGICYDKGYSPVYLDLGRYALEASPDDRSLEGQDLLEHVLALGLMPKMDASTLEGLALATQLVLIIDGLNEVTAAVRDSLFEFVRGLRRGSKAKCYVLATDRLGSGSPHEYRHFKVELLDANTVHRVYDDILGPGSFDSLDRGQQELLRLPFFLALVASSRSPLAGTQVSTVFRSFFRRRIGLVEEGLADLARLTASCVVRERSKFRTFLPPEVDVALLASGVVDENTGWYVHDLWQDFLVALHLAEEPEGRRYEVFEAATGMGRSVEMLMLTLEQLDGAAAGDDFLKAVFDWSYPSAAECVVRLSEHPAEERGISRGMENAITAAMAERVFDRFENTRNRASITLKRLEAVGQRDVAAKAKKLAGATTRDELGQIARRMRNGGTWYLVWRVLFSKADGDEMTDEEVGHLRATDSVIGWAAANAARRCTLSDSQLDWVRRTYGAYPDAPGIRWRVVHVLGAFPEQANAATLLKALLNDGSFWVCFGAARALMEIASVTDDKVILAVIEERFAAFFSGRPEFSPTATRVVLAEVIAGTKVRDARGDWPDDALRILSRIEDSVDPTDIDTADLLSRGRDALIFQDADSN